MPSWPVLQLCHRRPPGLIAMSRACAMPTNDLTALFRLAQYITAGGGQGGAEVGCGTSLVVALQFHNFTDVMRYWPPASAASRPLICRLENVLLTAGMQTAKLADFGLQRVCGLGIGFRAKAIG